MVRALLFDLDNTLYSDRTGMERDIVRRMTEYVSGFLGVSPEDAIVLRRERVRNYGTTLEWLMAEHSLTDADEYLAAIHPRGEEYCIQPDPELELFLDSIALPKAILTNSPAEHAERVLVKLGIADCFASIYDIRFNLFHGKPHKSAFDRVLAAFGYGVSDVFFVDDLRHCVRGFFDMGGYAALLDEHDRYELFALPRILSLYEIADVLRDQEKLATFRKAY
jgi:putative hydrolase of the HAD superfamily